MKLISETKKTPEVERAASKESSRSVLTHVYLNAENGTLEACDSYRAGVIPVEVEDGDMPALIPVDAMKAQRKASTKHAAASLMVSDDDIRLSMSDGERGWKKGEGQFPNLQQITPTDYSTFRVGLNPALLLETAKALGDGEAVTLEFTLQRDKVEGDDTGAYPDALRPIRVTVPNGGESYGILMPRRINVMRLALALGEAQAWLAQGYREGNALERVCIFPTWAVARGAFLVAYGIARARVKS